MVRVFPHCSWTYASVYQSNSQLTWISLINADRSFYLWGMHIHSVYFLRFWCNKSTRDTLTVGLCIFHKANKNQSVYDPRCKLFKSVFLKIFFFIISQPKYMLCVFKRTTSMRRFFGSKAKVKTDC